MTATEIVYHITAKMTTGHDFEAIGELVFDDGQIVIYDVDGGTAHLFRENLLWLVSVPQELPFTA